MAEMGLLRWMRAFPKLDRMRNKRIRVAMKVREIHYKKCWKGVSLYNHHRMTLLYSDEYVGEERIREVEKEVGGTA